MPTDIRIQDYAALLVFDRSSHHVTAASENLPQTMLGRSINEVFHPETAAKLRDRLAYRYPVPVPLTEAEPHDWRGKQAVPHAADDQYLIEIEPMESLVEHARLQPTLRLGCDLLSEASDLNAALDQICRLYCEDLGMERALVYELEEDGSGGTVRNEYVRHSSITPMLGFRFREEDFPREGFEVHSEVSIFGCAPSEGEDYPRVLGEISPTVAHRAAKVLGCRTPYPTIVQYLRQTGLGYQLSLALYVKGRLWGVVFAHHHERIVTDHQLRSTLLLLGKQLSQIVGSHIERRVGKGSLATNYLRAQIRENIASAPSFLDGFRRGDPSLQDFLPHSGGAAIRYEGELVLLGNTPPKRQVNELLDWVARQPLGLGPFHSESLGRDLPGRTFAPAATGALLLPLTRRRQNFLVWFRPEQLRRVTYGSRDIDRPDDGADRFTPIEEVLKGYSRAWTDEEINSAVGLRRFVREVVLQRHADLTRVNNRLRRAYDEMETFTYTMSHDLRAPLRGIEGYSEILIEEYGDKLDSEAYTLLRTVQDHVDHMNRIIGDILRLGRISRSDLHVEDCQVSDLVADALDRFRQKHEVVPSVTVHDDLPTIRGDARQLRVVFHQLISNAAKFTLPNRERQVAVGFRPGTGTDEGEFFVSDNGIGIAPEFQDRIFGMFNRLVGPDKYEGTGAGLAIVSRILQHHGGGIRVESESGRGATFLFFTRPEGEHPM